MRTLLSKALLAGVPALALLAAPALALDPQGPGADPPDKTVGGNVQVGPSPAGPGFETPRTADSLIGRQVRTEEDGRVIGEISDVIAGEGGSAPRVVISLEAHDHKPVAVELSQLRQVDNRWLITVPEDQLAALPAHEGGSTGATSIPLPMGGLAPGWGIPQGGSGR